MVEYMIWESIHNPWRYPFGGPPGFYGPWWTGSEMNDCTVCAHARAEGWYGLPQGTTHCRDCHRTFRSHQHHCTRCHETFNGERAADRHNPKGGLSVCHAPERKSLRCVPDPKGFGTVWFLPVRDFSWAQRSVQVQDHRTDGPSDHVSK